MKSFFKEINNSMDHLPSQKNFHVPKIVHIIYWLEHEVFLFFSFFSFFVSSWMRVWTLKVKHTSHDSHTFAKKFPRAKNSSYNILTGVWSLSFLFFFFPFLFFPEWECELWKWNTHHMIHIVLLQKARAKRFHVFLTLWAGKRWRAFLKTDRFAYSCGKR